MEIMNLNLSYDDRMDKWINPFGSPPVIGSDDPNHGGVFIGFKLSLNSLQIDIMHS